MVTFPEKRIYETRINAPRQTWPAIEVFKGVAPHMAALMHEDRVKLLKALGAIFGLQVSVRRFRVSPLPSPEPVTTE
jgi:hypothetical protein